MALFELAAKKTLKLEGGYQTLKNDSGNYNSKKQLVGTNHGISARTYEKWIKRPPTIADMKAITKSIALQIYKTWYWDALKLDLIKDQQTAEFIFDYAIHGGGPDAIKGTVKAWNTVFSPKLPDTNKVNNTIIKALNSLDPKKNEILFDRLKMQRIYDIKTQGGTTYDDSLIQRVLKFNYVIIEDLKKKPLNLVFWFVIGLAVYRFATQ